MQVEPGAIVSVATAYRLLLETIVATFAAALVIKKWVVGPVQKAIEQETKERKEDKADFDKRLREHMQTFNGYVELQIDLKTKVEVFWEIMKKGSIGFLHHDDTPGLDLLLERARDGVATDEELNELLQCLEKIEKGETEPVYGPDERFAALQLRSQLVAERRARERWRTRDEAWKDEEWKTQH